MRLNCLYGHHLELVPIYISFLNYFIFKASAFYLLYVDNINQSIANRGSSYQGLHCFP